MKTTVLFIALAVIAVASPAQTPIIYIPDNSSSTGTTNVAPFGGPEWRYQMHLDAAWIGTAGVIKDIAFASAYTQTFTTPKFEIRMSHTTLTVPVTSFATNLPNPVAVYPEGPFTWNATLNAWSPIGLKVPFHYNGVDNLTVEIRYENSTCTGNGGCHRSSTIYRTQASGTGSYGATTATYGPGASAQKIALYLDPVSIVGSGNPGIGGTVTLNLSAPADPTLPYQVGSSLGTGPIPIDTRLLNLSPDALLVASVQGYLPTVFSAYSGLLDSSGKGTAAIHIPQIPGLIGVRLHSAFVTIKAGAPSNLASISSTFSFSITK